MSIAPTTTALSLTPLTGTIGAEVHGVDLTRPVPEETRAALVAALDEHSVIFFPPQDLGETGLIDLAAVFGPVVTPANPLPDQPREEVLVLVNPLTHWHADTTWMEAPPGEQAFQVVELPEVGGDTVWASTEAAYESLSKPLRQAVDSLLAVHEHNRLSFSFGLSDTYEVLRQDRPPREHPLVRVHPRTGRKSLFVNPMYTTRVAGVSEPESRHLLQLLHEHVLRPEHLVRYRWQQGSIAVWDNRNTWHYAVNDYGDATRRVQRVSTEGEVPEGPRPVDGYFRGRWR